jgi:hypothetical protein
MQATLIKRPEDKPEQPTTFERRLMLAMNVKDVWELDELLSAPISQDAADHSEPPDEEYDLADRMYEETDRQWNAQKEFEALLESRYLN